MVDSFKLLEGVCIPSQRVAPSSLTALKDGVSNRSQFLDQPLLVNKSPLDHIVPGVTHVALDHL
jgi:hypothetical protein